MRLKPCLFILHDMKEIWKDIEGYEGHYKISNTGKVKTITRVITMKNGVERTYKSKYLKGFVNNIGYLCFDLYLNGIRNNIKAHYLVAYHFVYGYKKGLWVNHKDGNKLNNKSINLEWITPQQNSIHAFDTRLIVRYGDLVLQKSTGIFFDSVRDAHRTGLISCSRSHFAKQLKGIKLNTTDFLIV